VNDAWWQGLPDSCSSHFSSFDSRKGGEEGLRKQASKHSHTRLYSSTIFSVSEGRLSITKNPTILVDSSTIIRKTFLLLDS